MLFNRICTQTHSQTEAVTQQFCTNAWMFRTDEKRQSIWPDIWMDNANTVHIHTAPSIMDKRTSKQLENVRIQSFLSFTNRIFSHFIHKIHTHRHATQTHQRETTAPSEKNSLKLTISIRTYDYHHKHWFKLDQFHFNCCSIWSTKRLSKFEFQH